MALSGLTFSQKPNPCTRHGDKQQLLDAGLAQIMDNEREIVEELSQGELLELTDHGDHFHFGYAHPLLGTKYGSHWHLDDEDDPVYEDLDELRPDDVKRLIARDLFTLHAEYLAADAWTSRDLSAPLAVAAQLHERILGGTKVDPAAVAIELGVPILHGVPTRDIIKLRRDEGDAFERFRIALKSAINECIDRSDSTDPVNLAGEIIDDVMLPALANIRQRLQVAERVFTKKSVVNVGVGTAAVVVGLIGGLPLLLPAGVALGLGAPGIHFNKYLDERSAVELSDMYFLWQLRSKSRPEAN